MVSVMVICPLILAPKVRYPYPDGYTPHNMLLTFSSLPRLMHCLSPSPFLTVPPRNPSSIHHHTLAMRAVYSCAQTSNSSCLPGNICLHKCPWGGSPSLKKSRTYHLCLPVICPLCHPQSSAVTMTMPRVNSRISLVPMWLIRKG